MKEKIKGMPSLEEPDQTDPNGNSKLQTQQFFNHILNKTTINISTKTKNVVVESLNLNERCLKDEGLT